MTLFRAAASLRTAPRQWAVYALDVAVALAATSIYIGFANTEPTPTQAAFTGPGWLGLLIAGTVGLPLAVRRRWPLPVLLVVLAGTIVATTQHITLEPYLAVAYALYLVGLAEPVARSVPAVALVGVGAASAVLATEALLPQSAGTIAAIWLFNGASWVLGYAMRGKRGRAASEARRREQQAVQDERLRIAQELHDIVAHGMSVIAVKAAVASHVAEQRPEEAREALEVVAATSREALIEMRHLLGVLRSADDLDKQRAPVPSLAGLGELIDSAKHAGVAAELSVHGGDRLPDGVELTIYRLVQEGVTNVVKHAAPTECRVRVEDDGDTVRVEIIDAGSAQPRPTPATPGAGHGLIGMRERVAVYGGRFQAGPDRGGGFRVYAEFRYQGAQR